MKLLTYELLLTIIGHETCLMCTTIEMHFVLIQFPDTETNGSNNYNTGDCSICALSTLYYKNNKSKHRGYKIAVKAKR